MGFFAAGPQVSYTNTNKSYRAANTVKSRIHAQVQFKHNKTQKPLKYAWNQQARSSITDANYSFGIVESVLFYAMILSQPLF